MDTLDLSKTYEFRVGPEIIRVGGVNHVAAMAAVSRSIPLPHPGGWVQDEINACAFLWQED